MNISIHNVKEIKKSSIEKLDKSDTYTREFEFIAEIEDFKNNTKTKQKTTIHLFSDEKKHLRVFWK